MNIIARSKPGINSESNNSCTSKANSNFILPSIYKKVYIKTIGCQMNVYDTQKMLDLIQHRYGLIIADTQKDADILIVNTCSVREKAEDKVYSQLGRWNIIKRNKPHVLIGVTGCVATQEGNNIVDRVDYVDIVLGPQNIHKIVDAIEEVLIVRNENIKNIKSARNVKKKQFIEINFNEIEKFDQLPKPKATGFEAYVTIMEGCSKYCTFCIVPYTRGEEISRNFDDIVLEVKSLVTQGVKEIHLLGQNVNAYEHIFNNDKLHLSDLVYRVSEIEGVERIRFTTSHPVEFKDDLIEIFANVPKLVSHLHLPIQSGSNKILSLMQRNYTVEDYLEIIRKLKNIRPDISISSDFIIGFPGETEDDFLDTMSIIEKVHFDNSFSFIYSPRKGTPAATYIDNISKEQKERRLYLLQYRLRQIALSISEKLLNNVVEILVSNYSKKSLNQMQGRTQCNRIVNFFCNDHSLIGEIVKVKITSVNPNTLLGELVR